MEDVEGNARGLRGWLSIVTIEFFILSLRLFLSLLFLFSAVTKVFALQAFEKSISEFRLLPSGYERIVAMIIIGWELSITFWMMLGGGWTVLGFVSALLLAILLTSVTAAVRLRNLDADCNCFGAVGSSKIDEWSVLRNVILTLLIAAGLSQSQGTVLEVTNLGLSELVSVTAVSLLALSVFVLVPSLGRS